MKRIYFILILSTIFLLYLFSECRGQGYIHLKGKQFIDENGQPFFPMVMNYYIDFAYTGTTGPAIDFSNCYLEQSSLYGADGPYDYSDPMEGPNRILQDFYEMKNLGFNVVRIVMTPKKKLGQGFYLDIKKFPTGQDYFHPSIDPPYNPTNNDALQFYYDRVMQVIGIASTAGLKIMEICADGGSVDLGGDELIHGIAGDANIDDYRDFLISLADYIYGHNVHNLFAYEFQGEPTYAEKNLPAYHLKSEICSIADEWNTAIKQHDPHHLTTIGAVGLDDPFQGGWDPNLLKVDFTNVHFYLDPQIYEYNNDPTTFLTKAYKRYRDKFYIYTRSIKKPFIIGETGFPGENPGGNTSLVYPIATYGDELAQQIFVEETFPIIRNSGVSGYGWWDFQNRNYYGPPPLNPPYPHTLNDYSDQYLGLLRYGNPDPSDLLSGYENGTVQLRKLAAAKFFDYKNNPPAMPVSPDFGPVSPSVDMNEHYYNPFNHPLNSTVYTNSAGNIYYGTITGHIQDQYGNPIPRAILKGTSYVSLDNTTSPPTPILYAYYTYTDDNGDFELRNYDYAPSIVANFSEPQMDNVIADLKIASYGSDWTEVGWNGVTFQTPNTYVLKSLQSQFDTEVDNISIPIGNTQNFKAISTLTTLNFVVNGNTSQGGHSELKASNIVELKSGFHAAKGSEVHIFTEPLFIDCSDISFLNLKKANSNTSSTEENDEISIDKEVEINFHNKTEIIANIYPNPNHGDFTLQLSYNAKENSLNQISIKDCLGNQIMQKQFMGTQLQLSLPNLNSGIYFIYIQSEEKSIIQKFVII